MKILDMTSGERPREKLLERGPGALSDGELLAVLLRTGVRGCNALDTARELLSRSQGSLSGLMQMGCRELCRMRGVGKAKAAMLLAAFEIGKRFMTEDSGVEKRPILSARMAYNLMRAHFKGMLTEECWVLLLNHGGYCTAKELISTGGLASAGFDSRKVLMLALKSASSSVILMHNHPSGNPRPSQDDITVTNHLRRALSGVGLNLSDHVVASDSRFYSFTEESLYEA